MIIIKFLLILSPICLLNKASANSCRDYLSDNLKGAELLHKKDAKLHMTPVIQRAAIRQLKTRSAMSYAPVQKISAWLKSLHLSHQKVKEDKKYLDWFKSKIYDLYVIKPENVPESFFNQQVQIALEAGHGHLQLSKSAREALIDVVIQDQKSTLDVWINYFISDDSDGYPIWFKFWAFQGIVKLGKFDDARGVFSKRTLNTTAPFADLNSEAMTRIADNMLKHFRNESLSDIDDQEFRQLVERQNFVDLYTFQFRRLKKIVLDLSSNEGEWRIFKKGSDPKILTDALEGKSTGWCTAGLGYASKQLKSGDFHIYFSKDDKGNFIQPRIAIRMEDDHIAEVRGIAVNQNLDERISGANVLEKKLIEFGAKGAVYLTRSRHMKLLTAIGTKVDQGYDLTVDELKFLYEFNEKIQGFGYSADPRIHEIKSRRDIKKDLSNITGYLPHEIAYTSIDQNLTTAKVFYGTWVLGGDEGQDFHSIELLIGQIDVYDQILKNVRFPRTVIGKVDTYLAEIAENVIFPANLNGPLQTRGLTRAIDVIFPTELDELKMTNIVHARNLKFPRKVKEIKITSARKGDKNLLKPLNWTLPIEAETITLAVDNAKGLVFPMCKKIFFYRLMTYKDLVIPSEFSGIIDIPLLEDLENLIIPIHFSGTIRFQNKLPDLKQLKLPKNFIGKIESYQFIDTMPGNSEGGG